MTAEAVEVTRHRIGRGQDRPAKPPAATPTAHRPTARSRSGQGCSAPKGESSAAHPRCPGP